MKNKIYNYSIIIPHHNLSTELSRCLKCIPQKDDIEVFVVDDTSNECEVIKVKELEKLYPSYKFIYTQAAKGAGHARNLALKNVSGKWLLFVDCDDLLTSDCYDIWNKYLNSNNEIIYFRTQTVDADTLELNNSGEEREIIINRIKPIKKSLHRWLRTCYTQPWGKMIRRDFILNNNILFEESIVANDYLFSIKSGLLAKSIEYSNDIFYQYAIRQGSLSNNQIDSSKKIKSRLDVYYNIESIFKNNRIYLRPYSRFISVLKKSNSYSDEIENFCKERGYSSRNTNFSLLMGAIYRILPTIFTKLKLPYTGF